MSSKGRMRGRKAPAGRLGCGKTGGPTFVCGQLHITHMLSMTLPSETSSQTNVVEAGNRQRIRTRNE
ncbi:hypothetical protein VTK56DRAFT_3706 [Thermocarpiscus australiensis]